MANDWWNNQQIGSNLAGSGLYAGDNPPIGYQMSEQMSGMSPGSSPMNSMSGGNEPGWWDQMVGYKDPTTGQQTGGWGQPALQTGMGVAKLGLGAYGAYLGKEQLDLAEDQFDFQKDAWSSQFENQKALTNLELRDRQRRRLAANPNNMSEDEYMAKYGV